MVVQYNSIHLDIKLITLLRVNRAKRYNSHLAPRSYKHNYVYYYAITK